MDDAELMPLAHPIRFADEDVKELRLRRPRGADIRRLPSEVAPKHLLEMAARCASVPDPLIDALDAEDCSKLIEWALPFLPGGRRPGATP